jgi:predicted nucleic acid-binding Zn ribbon protein
MRPYNTMVIFYDIFPVIVVQRSLMMFGLL